MNVNDKLLRIRNSEGKTIFISDKSIKRRLAIAGSERPAMSDWNWKDIPEVEDWNKAYDKALEAIRAMHKRDPAEGAMLMLIDEIRTIWEE